MKNKTFNKKCDISTLHAELNAAGFQIYGITTYRNITIIHLKDSEKKDPSIIVLAHKSPLLKCTACTACTGVIW